MDGTIISPFQGEFFPDAFSNPACYAGLSYQTAFGVIFHQSSMKQQHSPHMDNDFHVRDIGAVVDERLRENQADPNSGRSWEEFEQEITAELNHPPEE